MSSALFEIEDMFAERRVYIKLCYTVVFMVNLNYKFFNVITACK